MVAILTVIAFLAATVPVSAQETISPAPTSSAKPASKAPLFIARGKPLTAQETVSMNQRVVFGSRISHDLGGDGDDDNINKADEVFVGIVVVAAIVGLVYITVLEAENSSKLF